MALVLSLGSSGLASAAPQAEAPSDSDAKGAGESGLNGVAATIDQFSPLRDLAGAATSGYHLGSELGHVDPLLGLGAMAAGSNNLREGVQKLQDGDVLRGSLSATGGLAGTMSGLATAVTVTTSTTAVAGVSLPFVAAAGGGVAATTDGIREVIDGSVAGDTGQIAQGSVKSLAGTLMMDGALTLDPYAAVGGAALWVGASAWDRRAQIQYGLEQTAETLQTVDGAARHLVWAAGAELNYFLRQ
jgi:hypothetical protein